MMLSLLQQQHKLSSGNSDTGEDGGERPYAAVIDTVLTEAVHQAFSHFLSEGHERVLRLPPRYVLGHMHVDYGVYHLIDGWVAYHPSYIAYPPQVFYLGSHLYCPLVCDWVKWRCSTITSDRY